MPDDVGVGNEGYMVPGAAKFFSLRVLPGIPPFHYLPLPILQNNPICDLADLKTFQYFDFLHAIFQIPVDAS